MALSITLSADSFIFLVLPIQFVSFYHQNRWKTDMSVSRKGMHAGIPFSSAVESVYSPFSGCERNSAMRRPSDLISVLFELIPIDIDFDFFL